MHIRKHYNYKFATLATLEMNFVYYMENVLLEFLIICLTILLFCQCKNYSLIHYIKHKPYIYNGDIILFFIAEAETDLS